MLRPPSGVQEVVDLPNDRQPCGPLPQTQRRKAVNWALRQIGKRNLNLNAEAIEAARRIQETDSRSARWVASDAIRELTGEVVQKRLRARGL
jgi:hypothetical protein